MKKFLIPFIASAGLLLAATTAFAATPLSGYAWSSNIGWLSFNSSDGSTVQLATTTGSSIGTLSGYAWSPNIGWVSFNRGFTGSPPSNDPGNGVGAIATVDMTTGAVSGWMRALAGCQYDLLDLNGKCTGAGPGNANGVTVAGSNSGWDGWIELSGANHPTVPNLSAISNTATSTQGISLNTSNNQLSGYAWGSDVVGWLSFNNGSTSNGTNSPVCLGTTCNPPPPSQSPIIVSACSISDRPTSPVNSGYQLTVNSTNGNVTASGGNNGSYTYLWSNDNISFSPQPTTLTFTNTSSSIVPETIFVEAQDSSGTSASHQCGTVAVNGTSVNNGGSVSLGVWPNSLVPSGTIPTTAQLTNMQPITVHTGSSVTLDYTYPTDDSLVCSGGVYYSSNPSWSPNIWTALNSLNANNIGSTVLSSMPIGVYKLDISCSSLSQRQSNIFMAILDNLFGQRVQASSPPTLSIPVEIDIVSSSIHEN